MKNEEKNSLIQIINERAAVAGKRIDFEGYSTEELFQMLQKGDANARELLNDYYRPMVINIADKYFRQYKDKTNSFDMDDLIQEGSIAMFQALQKYNPDEEAKFETYAYNCILNAIIKYCTSNSRIIHISKGERKKVANVMDAAEKLRSPIDGEPDLAKIAELCNMSITDVQNAMWLYETYYRVEDLNKTIIDDEITLLDVIPSKEDVFENVAIKLREDYLHCKLKEILNEKEKTIFGMKYGIDYEREYKLWEISEIIGTTKQYVSAAIKRIRKKLQRSLDVDAA